MITLNSQFFIPSTTTPVANGSIVLTLVPSSGVTILATGGAAPTGYTFNLDANGNLTNAQVWGQGELTPTGSSYTVNIYSGAGGSGTLIQGPFTWIIGLATPYSGVLFPNVSAIPFITINTIDGVLVTGTPTSGQAIVATGPAAATWQTINFASLGDEQAGTAVINVSSVTGVVISSSTNPAASGIVRLASTDSISWRNNANTGNIALTKNSSDALDASAFAAVKAAALQNASLNGAGNGNSVTLLNQQGATSALTGNSSDQTVYTYTLPANTLGSGKGLRITVVKLHTQGTTSTTYKLNVGGTVWRSDSYAVQAANSQNERLVYYLFNNSGVQNAQNGYSEYWLYNSSAPASGTINQIIAPLTAAIDFTSLQAISFTFNVSSGDKEKGQFFLIELIQ